MIFDKLNRADITVKDNIFKSFFVKKPYLEVLFVFGLIMVAVPQAHSNDKEGEGVSHNECDYWGGFAKILNENVVMMRESGDQDAIQSVKETIGYLGAEPGSIGRVYYSGVFEAIESGANDEKINHLAIALCQKYPEGTFNPNDF